MARGPLRDIGAYLRKYPLAPRYPRECAIRLQAADGTRLAAHRLVGPDDAPATAVVVHGFVNWSRSPGVHAFSVRLAQRLHVIAPDLRGHGRSGGRCSLGSLEHLDVAAAVDAAPDGLPVVTIGVSLGGVAVLRHAAVSDTVAAVVAVSAPARGDSSRPGSQRMTSVTSSRTGRRVLSSLMRTRLADGRLRLPDVAEELARVAPARCVIVHDRHDHFFGPEHAEALHAAASDPKELWWYDGAGHGIDLLTPAFADRLVEWVEGVLLSG